MNISLSFSPKRRLVLLNRKTRKHPMMNQVTTSLPLLTALLLAPLYASDPVFDPCNFGAKPDGVTLCAFWDWPEWPKLPSEVIRDLLSMEREKSASAAKSR